MPFAAGDMYKYICCGLDTNVIAVPNMSLFLLWSTYVYEVWLIQYIIIQLFGAKVLGSFPKYASYASTNYDHSCTAVLELLPFACF
jgi:hypothetical protein